ncbi:hypothetical protein GOL78_08920, partial [Sinorhizobium medicae]|nr:hypothetical protein [Sinorhizobium medicae]MDX1209669.1 hypothetical protein [Sinorhizobium medicae]
MKSNRFTDEQIITIWKEHEAGTPVSERCRNDLPLNFHPAAIRASAVFITPLGAVG